MKTASFPARKQARQIGAIERMKADSHGSERARHQRIEAIAYCEHILKSDPLSIRTKKNVKDADGKQICSNARLLRQRGRGF